jgi:3-methylcrotonyl-CoA carboxylase alpha subunit
LYDAQGVAEEHTINGHHPQFEDSRVVTNPWLTLGPWRMLGEARRLTYRYANKEHTIALRPAQESIAEAWNVQVDAQPEETITCMFGNEDFVLIRSGTTQVRAYVQHYESETQVILHGQAYRLERRQPPDVDMAAHGGSATHSQKALTAPMAGTIIKVQVHEGDIVKQRQVLAILSAMKMEHTIIAPYEGKVRRVHYAEGAVVKGGAVIVEME